MRLVAFLSSLALLGACRTEERPAAPSAGISHRAHANQGINCVRCHRQFQTDDPPGTLHLPADATCTDGCHENVHPDMPDRAACGTCHVDPDTPAILAAMKADLRFDHVRHLKETRGDCVTCHRGAIDPLGTPKGALPDMASCGRCHEAALASTDCQMCHKSLIGFPLRPITIQAHTADFMRRHGQEARAGGEMCTQCHGQSFCADCHEGGRAPMPANVAYADRPDRAFIHRPGYKERHAAEARLEGPLCLTCHSESDCQTCHRLAGYGPGGLSPHTGGWVSAFGGQNRHAQEARRDILGCVACHGGAGADLCVECHAPGRPGGSPHASRRPAGDPVRDQPCRRCHG